MAGGELSIIKIMWHSGLVVKLVLAVLLFASILSWAIILRKRKMLKALNENNHLFMEAYYQAENLKEVMLRTQTLDFSSYYSMFINGYNELARIKDDFEGMQGKSTLRQHFKDFGLGMIERALRKGVSDINVQIEHHLGILASIGSITPFVGLFGTVWGIINSFTGLAGGGATLDAVAPGIAEALVATAMGLFAAIPAVWFYNHFSTINEKLNSQMEIFGQDFLNLVERTLVIKGGH